MTCDDGIFCTVDRCQEPGLCTHAATDSLCEGGGTCDAVAGCVVGCGFHPCDPVAQCGCDGGLACTFDGLGLACVEPGGRGLGAVCDRAEECAPGTHCGDRGGGVRSCVRACHADADCPGGGTACIPIDGAPIGYCTDECNPAAQRGCPEGLGCSIVDWRGRYVTVCLPPTGDRGQGTPCTRDVHCLPGHHCVEQPHSWICAHWCLSPRDCEAGLECYSLVEPWIVDGLEYGVCL